MLFAGWEVRIVKNCDRHFQAQGHSFSLYGPTLSRKITNLFFPAVNWLTSRFVYTTLSLNWLTRHVQTIAKS